MKYRFAFCNLILVSAGLLLFVSCKDPVPGCMNVNAENYSAAAEEDDGTCSFRGSAVFYHDAATAEQLLADGVTSVRLFVDGSFMDSMSPNVSFNFVPSCDHPDAMKMQNFGIGNLPSKSFTYQIKDQLGNILDFGMFEMVGNECTAVKYNY